MSLPETLQKLVSSQGSTLQDLALLHYLKHGEQAVKPLQYITALKVCQAGFNHLKSKDEEIEALRAQTIVNVANFVKNNPRARPQEVQQVLAKEITEFSQNVSKIV